MNSDNAFWYIIGGVIVFVIGVFVTRAIFSIPKFMRLQEAQLEVLVEIAKQQGVKAEVLLKIHTSNDLAQRAKTNEELRKSKTPADEALENEALSHPKE